MIFWVKSYNVAGKPPRFSVAEINIIPLGVSLFPALDLLLKHIVAHTLTRSTSFPSLPPLQTRGFQTACLEQLDGPACCSPASWRSFSLSHWRPHLCIQRTLQLDGHCIVSLSSSTTESIYRCLPPPFTRSYRSREHMRWHYMDMGERDESRRP